MITPILSIVITTYNMEKYIARAIDSVLLQQTNFPIEIVIADDCSTDKTLDIVESYKEKNPDIFQIIYAKENKGLIHNFVKGLKHCNGKYIATLDADDYWIDEKKLQKQFDILQEYHDVGYVYTNFFYEEASSKQRTIGLPLNHQYNEKDNYTDTLMNLWPQISTPCIKQDLLDFQELEEFVKLNFHCQDLPLFLSLSLKTKGFYIKDITTVYSVISGSLSRNLNIKKRIETFKKTKSIEDYFIAKHPIPREINDKRIFLHKQKILLASWFSNDFDYVKSFTKELSFKDFLTYNPKAAYVFIASRHKILYQLFKPWLTRKRPPGK